VKHSVRSSSAASTTAANTHHPLTVKVRARAATTASQKPATTSGLTMAARVSLRASLPSLYRKQETKRSRRFRAPTAVGAWWDALVVTSQQPCESVADELYRPSRVVDRDQRSWMLTCDPDGNDVHTARPSALSAS
jgi:hypothetical protein